MDRVPASPQAVAAIAEYDRSLSASELAAPDVSHRCVVGKCRYYISHQTRCAVCKESRQTHRCGDNCPLATQMGDTTLACAITGFQVHGVETVQYVSAKRNYAGARASGQHWTTKQIARKATPRAQQRLAVASMLRRLFCSAERVAITDKAYERVAAIATKVGKRMKIAGGAPVTVAQFHAIRALFVERQDALREPLPHDVPPAFVTYVVDGINLLRTEARKRKLAMKVGDQSATLAIVQLLTTGFAPKGVTIIHKVDLVARHMYRASMYSQLANIRCRGQTICARQICRILVTATGDGAWRFPRYTTER